MDFSLFAAALNEVQIQERIKEEQKSVNQSLIHELDVNALKQDIDMHMMKMKKPKQRSQKQKKTFVRSVGYHEKLAKKEKSQKKLQKLNKK